MSDSGAEHQNGVPVPCDAEDFRAGSLHVVSFAHGAFHLVRLELAVPDGDAVRLDFVFRNAGTERAEIVLFDERLDADFIADLVQNPVLGADHSGGSPVWRCRKADDPQIRIDSLEVGKERPVSAVSFLRDHVCLVNDHEVEHSKFIGLFIDRLDSGQNAFMFKFPSFEPGRVDSHVDVAGDHVQLFLRLEQEFLHMGEEQDTPVPPDDGIADDGRQHGCFASASRNHHAWIVFFFPEMIVNSLDRIFLIQPEFHASAPKLDSGCNQVIGNPCLEFAEPGPGEFHPAFHGVVGIALTPEEAHQTDLFVLDVVDIVAHDLAVGAVIVLFGHDSLEALHIPAHRGAWVPF